MQLPPYPRRNSGRHGVGVPLGGLGQSRQRAGETWETAKNVGVKETSPRRPHFIIAEKIQQLEGEMDKILIEKILKK